MKVKDTRIVANDSWSRKHWKSILSSYRQAPYLLRYADFSEDAGADTYYQDYCHPEHSQLFDRFESHLLNIDLILNCGQDNLGILMGGNISRAEMDALFHANTAKASSNA